MQLKFIAALAAALCLSFGAHAQEARVVASCGTLPAAYAAGSTQYPTVDVNGKLCLQSASAPPSGTAGGDLGGTYPNPTVTNGSHITNSSIPNSGLATPAPCSVFGTTSGTCAQGNIGTSLTASATTSNLSNNTSTNITSVAPGAGTWACEANANLNPIGTTTTTFAAFWLSTASADTLPTLPAAGYVFSERSYAAGTNDVFATGIRIFASPAHVYLNTESAFAVSTQTASGFLSCWQLQ